MGELTVIASAPVGLGWQWQAILRLAVAAALGAMVGAEREHHGRPAGFRTHLLVCLGAALAMVVSLSFGEMFGKSALPGVRVDPARVAYGVMAGIGFLGAGAIIQQRARTFGLTTAASLWCTAAMGLACGCGMFLVASVATLIVIFALVVLRQIDTRIPTQMIRTVTVAVPISEEDNVERIRQALGACAATVLDVEIVRDSAARIETLSFRVNIPSRQRLEDVFRLESQVPEITKLSVS